jgi:hypothetical protein
MRKPFTKWVCKPRLRFNQSHMSPHFRITLNNNFFANHPSPNVFSYFRYEQLYTYNWLRVQNCTIFIYGIHKLRHYFLVTIRLVAFLLTKKRWTFCTGAQIPLRIKEKDVAKLCDYILCFWRTDIFHSNPFFVCLDSVRLFIDKAIRFRSLISADQSNI